MRWTPFYGPWRECLNKCIGGDRGRCDDVMGSQVLKQCSVDEWQDIRSDLVKMWSCKNECVAEEECVAVQFSDSGTQLMKNKGPIVEKDGELERGRYMFQAYIQRFDVLDSGVHSGNGVQVW